MMSVTHRSMRCISTWLLLLTTSLAPGAQNVLPIGQWRSHLPYNTGQWVTQSDEKVYYATNWAILSIDKEEESIDFLSTVEGLSNTGIERIRYNRFSDILIVVYDNSVIDLVKPNGIVTMSQIKNFTNLSGEKRILDIHVENDSIVYLATNFGISKVNIFANEFVFTTFTGIDVEAVGVYDGLIYAGTAEGIYTIDRNALNPENFGTWAWLGPENGFPGDYSTHSVATFAGKLYIDVNDTLFRYENEGLQRIRYEPGHRIEYLSAEGAHLLAGFQCVSGCTDAKVYYFTADGDSGRLSSACLGSPRYAIEDEQGRIWFADGFRFFRSLDGLDDDNCNFMTINSPFSESNREITIFDNEVWLASGGVDQRFNNRFLRHGFASFIDGQWTIYNPDNLKGLQGEDPDDPNDNLLDIISIAIHPENRTVYAASYFEGLLEFDRENSTFYNEKNSSLGNAVGDETRTRVSGLKFDEENNLWMSNYLAERPLSVLKNDGSWQSFNLSCGQTQLHQLDIDENGYKWIVVNGGQAGVVLFDEGDLDNMADDRCRLFTSSNSELPTNQVNTLVVDQEGDIWVGTAEGVVIFECGGSAFDDNCRGSRRIIQQDGVNAYLLGTEEIQTIAVDGANRKWIGTRNGIFVLSPDGEEEVARFTTDNSPLFDNHIIDIAVNQQTGEVFIGTNKGVISYQSDAVEGRRVHREDLLVFPNPVRPDYNGPIAIRGLARNANVKITDINGQLVFETQALGGQAIWNGRDYTGRRANSGVYLVFSTSNPRDVGFAGKADAAVARIVLLNGGGE
jgi:hypothetical protein